ncbi:MAG: SUMF1/EgtB/PvdO family nonheme iron enzyme, partial [Arenicellales bacterium]|nr:SUMF1/EgtB/PvdO family nonheme iron enzyme [Arenicellales bacterium]
GNSSYEHAKLRNTINDAKDVAAVLSELEFDVILKTDVNRREMRQALREFGGKLEKDSIGLFYFSGHGVQVHGENYLVPLGTDIETEDEVPDESVSASAILSKIESAKNRLNIVILDACRNNPFARSFRSTQTGLAKIDAPLGSIVAYSTAPGSVAADGRGRNGTYTKHLLAAMKIPGLSIEQVFKQVRNSVIDATSGKQIPWEETSLRDDFYFSEKAVIADNSASITLAKATPPEEVFDKKESMNTVATEVTLSPSEVPDEAAFRDELDEGSHGPWLITIPSGEFTMRGSFYNEQPVHSVFIEDEFSIMAYEVTAEEYQKFADETGRNYTPGKGSIPAVNVSWFDAKAYADWLSEKTGQVYRLPSESEWEYVARGGGSSGGGSRDVVEVKANCKDCDTKWARSRSVAVNSLSRELAGTRGMLGNVWEWVEDCWIETYDPSLNTAKPRVKPNCSNKTLRGGSWNYVRRYSTPSARMGVSAYTKTDYIGFRLVRENTKMHALAVE